MDKPVQPAPNSQPPAAPPSTPPPSKRSFAGQRFLVHGLRVALFTLIVLLIHWQHQKASRTAGSTGGVAFEVADVQAVLPQAARLGQPTEQGGREALDAAGEPLGYAVQTSPAGDHVVGFSGPTNVLLVFDERNQLAGLRILSSRDTQDHVAAINNDPRFLQALEGTTWEQLAEADFQVDAVSGATLTSVAILESVVERLGGGEMPSLRFPDPLTVADVRPLFPQAHSVSSRETTHGGQMVFDAQGTPLGSVLRTSPAADQVIGYQGPTETLISFDKSGRSLGFVIRRSYDNEEYVGYVRDGEYFQSLFHGLTLAELAGLDLREADVEGVSGATMTSLAVAQGLVQAAAERQRDQTPKPAAKKPFWTWQPRDWGTTLILLGGLVIGLTKLRGRRWIRLPFQAALIVYLGFINGDLVSQALLAGWAQSGVPWRTATGLVLLTLAAVVVPITTRTNVYCHHLCPHGAAQQLLMHRLPWRVTLPKPVVWVLSAVPSVLLGVVVLVAMLSLPFGLVSLEPFDAYVFRIAGTATLVIFFTGLAASLFVPMAYCRFGCPTGALLGYLRFHRKSDRLSRQDAVAVGLLALALLLFAASP